MAETLTNNRPWLSGLNKGFIGVCVFLAAIFLVDVFSVKKNVDRRKDTQKTLILKKRSGELLKGLYLSLDKDKGALGHELDFDGRNARYEPSTDMFDHRMQVLAEQHNLVLDWTGDLEGNRPDASKFHQYTVVSLSGDYLGFRSFLLDVMALPDVTGVPLIQVISGKGRLNMMLNLWRIPDRRDGP